MTLDEMLDETLDVLAELERLGCHLWTDPLDVALHIVTPLDADLGDLPDRWPTVAPAIAAVVEAEATVRESRDA